MLIILLYRVLVIYVAANCLTSATAPALHFAYNSVRLRDRPRASESHADGSRWLGQCFPANTDSTCTPELCTSAPPAVLKFTPQLNFLISSTAFPGPHNDVQIHLSPSRSPRCAASMSANICQRRPVPSRLRASCGSRAKGWASE